MTMTSAYEHSRNAAQHGKQLMMEQQEITHAAGILRAGTQSYPRQRHVYSQAG
jgi:hypothetical protein